MIVFLCLNACFLVPFFILLSLSAYTSAVDAYFPYTCYKHAFKVGFISPNFSFKFSFSPPVTKRQR